MPNVPGLRSPYLKIGRIVYLPRMLDKIRLHATGKLPGEYIGNLGDEKPGAFDTRCCHFLGVRYTDLKERALRGEADDAILAWAEASGKKNTDEDYFVWNAFMTKRGWRDNGTPTLGKRIVESRLEDKPIMTMFDYLDFDEGRDPVAARAWES